MPSGKQVKAAVLHYEHEGERALEDATAGILTNVYQTIQGIEEAFSPKQPLIPPPKRKHPYSWDHYEKEGAKIVRSTEELIDDGTHDAVHALADSISGKKHSWEIHIPDRRHTPGHYKRNVIRTMQAASQQVEDLAEDAVMAVEELVTPKKLSWSQRRRYERMAKSEADKAKSKPICPRHKRSHRNGRVCTLPAPKIEISESKSTENKPLTTVHGPENSEHQLKAPATIDKKTLAQGNANHLQPGASHSRGHSSDSGVPLSRSSSTNSAARLLGISSRGLFSPKPIPDLALNEFNRLRGIKSSHLNGMAFIDPDGKKDKKLFTIHVMSDDSCMIFEGSDNMLPPLGFIKLKWSPLSKGPVFAVGDPYLAITSGPHPKSRNSSRATYSSYIPAKGRKAAPYLTFIFLPHIEDKMPLYEKGYTWRARLNPDGEEDFREIELREGDKLDVHGQVIAQWKMDGQDGEFNMLYYRLPWNYSDRIARKRWMAVLLLTSKCVMQYGMGSKTPIIK